MTVEGKHILLGITGSIAAYKAAMLVRLLVRAGAEVRVVMSASARDFITPLTLATLSKHPVLIDGFDPTNGAWNSHIKLGEWADHYLIAPATANTIAKCANGLADNLLTCTYLSARCPVSIAPAMDLDMYHHPATQANIARLRELGVGIIEPATGELASGLVGAGRMEEPEQIVAYLAAGFVKKKSDAGSIITLQAENQGGGATGGNANRNQLAGKRVMITAGATVEAIDPVRYISNFSTGKMGFALATEMANRGAEVTLIHGHVDPALLSPLPSRITPVQALSAADMLTASREYFAGTDCAVFCAAVADYTPADPAAQKIKHSARELTLRLEPTADIAATLSAGKRPGQVTVGFALETHDGERHAREKLARKNLDAIVLNSLSDPGAGFSTDTNKVTIISAQGAKEYPLKSKAEVASDIADYITTILR